jgi:hypothetical protein
MSSAGISMERSGAEHALALDKPTGKAATCRLLLLAITSSQETVALVEAAGAAAAGLKVQMLVLCRSRGRQGQGEAARRGAGRQAGMGGFAAAV